MILRFQLINYNWKVSGVTRHSAARADFYNAASPACQQNEFFMLSPPRSSNFYKQKTNFTVKNAP